MGITCSEACNCGINHDQLRELYVNLEQGLGDEASEIVEGSGGSSLKTGMVTSLFSFHDD